MLQHQHAQAVCLLAGGAGRAPETKAARVAACLNQLGKQFGAQQLKRAAVAEEAGLVDGHGLRDGALKWRIPAQFQVLHQLFQMRHALVAQQLGQPRLEQVVARGVKHVPRKAEDKLAKIAVVHALGSLHD